MLHGNIFHTFSNTPMATLCEFVREAAILDHHPAQILLVSPAQVSPTLLDLRIIELFMTVNDSEHSSMFHVCVAWWCFGQGTMYGPKKMSCIARLQTL